MWCVASKICNLKLVEVNGRKPVLLYLDQDDWQPYPCDHRFDGKLTRASPAVPRDSVDLAQNFSRPLIYLSTGWLGQGDFGRDI